MILSIVVVSWNTKGLLAQCLEPVSSHQLAVSSEQLAVTGAHSGRKGGKGSLAVEVLVVDNASSDGSTEMVRERFPQVQLLPNQENVGFARANNQAIRGSSGRYVLLLNPDTEVRPGALETLVAFMETHPEAGAAGAQLLNPDGTLQTSCYPAPTLSRELWRLFHLDALRPYSVYQMADWPSDRPRPVDVLLGACLMLRREVLDQVGLLDEAYFMYSEEVDLCYRIRQAGWQIYWVPGAEIVHYGGQSTRQAATEMFMRLYQGKVLYFRKNHGRLAARAYKLILLAASLCRLAVAPLAWLERPRQRRRHLALADRYWRLVLALVRL